MYKALKEGLLFEFRYVVPDNKTVPDLYPEAEEFRTYPHSLCHYELENSSTFSCSSLNSFGVRFPREL